MQVRGTSNMKLDASALDVVSGGQLALHLAQICHSQIKMLLKLKAYAALVSHGLVQRAD